MKKLLIPLLVFSLVACNQTSQNVKPKQETKLKKAASSSSKAKVTIGKASYYANSLHGNKTASGKRYNKNALTAAHRTLPFGTQVKVTLLGTNKSVVVIINDRGPHIKTRIIDLSGRAAKNIGLIKKGIAKVKLEILK